MKLRDFLPVALALALSSCSVSFSTDPPAALPAATAGTQAQRQEVFEATKQIIHAMDRGEFAQVWDASSKLLQASTSKTVFSSGLAATRGKLGKPDPRPQVRAGFTTKVDPNAPLGEYAVVEVDTTFGERVITEKVVLAKESGQWKLVGYFMKASQTWHL